MTLLSSLVEEAARRLGPDWDIEIVEMHHNKKVDAPSGTALALGEAAAKGRGVDLHDVAQRARDGHTGPRRAGDIGFAVLRGGDVAGEHTVIFAAAGERIEARASRDDAADLRARRDPGRALARRKEAGALRHEGRPGARVRAARRDDQERSSA